MDADNQDEKPFSLRLTRYSDIQMSPQRDARSSRPSLERSPWRRAFQPPSEAHRVWDTGEYLSKMNSRIQRCTTARPISSCAAAICM